MLLQGQPLLIGDMQAVWRIACIRSTNALPLLTQTKALHRRPAENQRPHSGKPDRGPDTGTQSHAGRS